MKSYYNEYFHATPMPKPTPASAVTPPPTISKACADYAATHGYAYYAQRNAYPSSTASASAITSELKNASSHVTITLTCGTGTSKLIGTLLQYVDSNGISVLPLRETDLD